ncbi:hypothetical protein DDE82_004661 [Stemphylium lycopersici]|uniref:AB hydrolase-1 domain-containing protein n=1 Tax=Stemphylium lycopersici TaxID=183478 RepID=A0A364N829_STELY|nr:prolyl aminopeptidase protein [Stemphylium lycopersici]RAR04222.1 hypothetical protein DDE82_004661 [Stemphylium lycopersici]RAR13474.1 hypothetical protein DDE83_003205 [Stemphylium lycopersici]
MSKPEIVLVPGAAHTPECMALLMAKLKTFGYSTHCRQMASVGDPTSNPPEGLSGDIAVLRSVVEEAIGEGNDVVVVPHSWGGVVAGSALVGYSKKEREACGKKGGVIRTGYMASIILPKGVSLMEEGSGTPPPWMEIRDQYAYCLQPEAFYNDLPEVEQKYWFSICKPHAVASFQTKTTGAAWKLIPMSYLLCEEDLAIPLQHQEDMIKAAKEAGAEIDVTRFKCGHSPFLSKVNETADWVRRVAGEKV